MTTPVYGLVVGLSLGSAFGSAVSTTLKTAAARRTPAPTGGGVRGVGRFARATVANGWWLAAIGADLAGVGLQVAALHLGALALVQPLLVSGLLFALLLRHVGRWRMTVAEAVWAVVVAACLTGFLLLSGAVDGVQQPADRGVAVISAVIAGAVVGICVVAAHRGIRPAGKAALLGAAVGMIYATTAALIKSATGRWATDGASALLASWQLYTVLVVAAGGLFLAQVAFQAGPLTASLPTISTVDPLLSVLIGVAIYDERLKAGPAHGTVLLILVLTLIIAVFGLARVDRDTQDDRPLGDPLPGMS